MTATLTITGLCECGHHWGCHFGGAKACNTMLGSAAYRADGTELEPNPRTPDGEHSLCDCKSFSPAVA
jgi:hypothetical protein